MSTRQKIAGWMIALSALMAAVLWLSAMAEEGQFGTPKGTEGSRIFKATEHPYYSGEFHFKGERTTLIGSMRDTSPWDHLDYAGKRLSSMKGTIEIDVNEVTNTGRVVAEFVEDTDRYRIIFDRFAARASFQDGGIATRIFTSMATQVTAIPCIRKPGSTLLDGGRPRCGRTIKSCIKTMTRTSW